MSCRRLLMVAQPVVQSLNTTDPGIENLAARDLLDRPFRNTSANGYFPPTTLPDIELGENVVEHRLVSDDG